MTTLKDCFTTLEYTCRDTLMDIDGDEVMEIDEEEKMDIDNYNISDYFSFSHSDSNTFTNDNLAYLFKMVKSVCLEADKSNNESDVMSDEKEKNNNDMENTNHNLIIKDSPKSPQNISKDQGSSKSESSKMAQYVIDSVVYSILDEYKCSPPNEPQDSKTLSENVETENSEFNSNDTTPESQDLVEAEENSSLENDLSVVQSQKLLECKVVLERIDDKDTSCAVKSPQHVSMPEHPSTSQKLEEQLSDDNELGKKHKKRVSLGQITIITYNSLASPIKSDFQETEVYFSELSSKLKHKVLAQKENSEPELEENLQNSLVSCSSKEINSLFNPGNTCEPNPERNEHNLSEQETSSESPKKLESQELKMKNCSIKIKRLPVLDMFLSLQNQTSTLDFQICCLCEEKKLFLSKESLITHLQEVHFHEICEPKMKVLMKSFLHVKANSQACNYKKTFSLQTKSILKSRYKPILSNQSVRHEKKESRKAKSRKKESSTIKKRKK